MVQWIRVRLQMQGTRVQSLGQDDCTCCKVALSQCTTTAEAKLWRPGATSTEACDLLQEERLQRAARAPRLGSSLPLSATGERPRGSEDRCDQN